jgi:hypothetical protein
MKAINWTTWDRYLPSAKVETRTEAAVMYMKPWDQILPEEGVEERMASTEQLWRTWERYLPGESADAETHLLSGAGAERPEKVHV